ncbi:MAG: NAD(P)H-hydrate dehydratase [Bacteroidales bacterium]|nr:NAD(P)H-hydrate dehydratase [Bacteroidales bacterium]
MKILSIDQVREADAYTIAHEPITSTALMERAGVACTDWIKGHIPPEAPVVIFAGPGNNGGDGLVIARHLYSARYSVKVCVLAFTKKHTLDFSHNLIRLKKETEIEITHIAEKDAFPVIASGTVIIDALLGSGLTRPAAGLAGACIEHINSQHCPVIAIDLPSGLFADEYTDHDTATVIQATHTLSLELPKYALFFACNHRWVGLWHIIPIGLHQEYINNAVTGNHLYTDADAVSSYKLRSKFSHKGSYGHALLLSGSYGKTGAAVLSAHGAMASGAGLLTAHLPKVSVTIMQTSLPECIVSVDQEETYITHLPDLQPYSAIATGPGIGFEERTEQTIKLLIQTATVPIIFDADAITILANNPTWLAFVPPGSVFTPHPKEFERLAGKAKDDFERLSMARAFAVKHRSWVVLKGAHTVVVGPDGTCLFNDTGNPGLAKGGTGDTLTGIILGLLAQGYKTHEALPLAVFAHGMAADIVAEEKSKDAIMASDISNYLGVVWKILEQKKIKHLTLFTASFL